MSLRHGDATIHGADGRDIEVRGADLENFAMHFRDGATRQTWWQGLASTLAKTRALAEDSGATLRPGVVARDADDAPGALDQVYSWVMGAPAPQETRRERAMSRDETGRAPPPGDAQAAYRQVVALVIRPPRARYDPDRDLGPRAFHVPRRFLVPGVAAVEGGDVGSFVRGRLSN